MKVIPVNNNTKLHYIMQRQHWLNLEPTMYIFTFPNGIRRKG
jgi:hypothetical protein